MGVFDDEPTSLAWVLLVAGYVILTAAIAAKWLLGA